MTCPLCRDRAAGTCANDKEELRRALENLLRMHWADRAEAGRRNETLPPAELRLWRAAEAAWRRTL